MEEGKPPYKPSLGFKRPRFNAPALVNKNQNIQPANNLGTAKVNQIQEDDAKYYYYFQVLYCKYQPAKKLRKNKSFNDGILSVAASTNKAILYDSEGKIVSQTTLKCSPATLGEGSELVMGGWELELDQPIPAEDFTSGKCFLKPSVTSIAIAPSSLGATPGGALNNNTTNTIIPVATAAGGGFKRPGFKPVGTINGGGSNALGGGGLVHRNNNNNILKNQQQQPPKALGLHDPTLPKAIVLNAAQWNQGKGVDASGRCIAPVVVDPFLAKHLRPHQIEGVKFLYECTMGLRDGGRLGCILADEMGLGKTLQVLTLIWTLLKQGPYGRPAVNKVLVVTPSSLTRNWAEEAKLWLGDERLRTILIQAGADGAQQALDFKHGQVFKVAITSYETLRKHADVLSGVAGLLVADEGHRLKSAQGNKTISALSSLNCPRRVLLTGTPIQNQLEEFYAMVNFVNPDALGTLPVFNRIFAAPIAKSRDKNATAEEKSLGNEREQELSSRVQSFLLRRTGEINNAYLPPLSLYVVFCRPSEIQLQRMSALLGSGSVKSLLSATGSDFGDRALSVLTTLRKLCNHPSLVPLLVEEEEKEADCGGGGGSKNTGSNNTNAKKEESGKTMTLFTLLEHIITVENERCVVVSQSTTMLDLISIECAARGYKTARIDGKTDVTKRQDVVNAFNRFNVGQVFLLSTTAGGAGLNLVGANRLILVDSHWNPANDAQAMARIWRDKQTKPCTIYRLVLTGTLEEKIYQRQRAKNEIASIMGAPASSSNGASTSSKNKANKGKGGQFSKEELRQLFTLRTNTPCDTAEVLQGTVDGETFKDVSVDCEDGPLRAAVEGGHVTFVHLERKEVGGLVPVKPPPTKPNTAAGGIPDAANTPSSEKMVSEEEEECEDEDGGLVVKKKKEVVMPGNSNDEGETADELQVEDDDPW